MEKSHFEEYVGAIYRLCEKPDKPLPLARLNEHFGFSPISVHEMIQKLEYAGLVIYRRYLGVVLTERGLDVAQALVRRHRIWERFLTDILEIPWDDAHEIAGQLEHAASENVTERLAQYMGNPVTCPHGAQIPSIGARGKTIVQPQIEERLDRIRRPGKYRVVRFFPESQRFLHPLHESGIEPGIEIRLDIDETDRLVLASGSQPICFSNEVMRTVWVEPIDTHEE